MPLPSRKIAECIYGGHQPRDVAAAVALGILGGAIVGGNISWAPLLLAAILFNVHTRLFLAAWLATALLACLAQASLETLGRFLLDDARLGYVVGQMGEGVIVALSGWDQYALVGGLAVGALLATVGAYIAYRLTARLGSRWSQACGTEGTDLRGSHSRTHVGIVTRFWFGLSRRERLLRRTMEPRRLRPYGVPAALATLLACAVAPWWIAGTLAERDFLRQLSAYNGAEVTSGDTRFSLWTGDFAVRDLQIADPQRLDRDRLRIGLASGKLSPGALLRGRLDIERLVLENVRADVARRQPARSYHNADRKPAPTIECVTSPRTADLDISFALRHWKSACRQLGTLEHLVAAVERLSQAETSGELAPRDRSIVGHRSDLGTCRPRVMVRQARVVGLPSGWNLGRKSLIELTDLSSNPPLSKSATEIKIVLPKFGAELQLQFASGPGRSHTLQCSAYDVELAPLIQLPDTCPVVLQAGRARLSGKGTFDRHRLDLRLFVEVDSLSAADAGRRSPEGIEAALWSEGLKRLGAFNAEIVLAGPWASPAIAVERQQLVEQFRRQLGAADEYQLAAAVEQHLAQGEAEPAESVVMQATALETEPTATSAGLCEFSDDDASTMPAEAYNPSPKAVEGSERQPVQPFKAYPATSAAKEDAMFGPPPVRATPSPAKTVRRPLPGPINMTIGRDPFVVTNSAAEKRYVRESLLRRWTDDLRQKVGKTFSKPASSPAAPTEPANLGVPTPREERVGSSAASDTYNRRWR